MNKINLHECNDQFSLVCNHKLPICITFRVTLLFFFFFFWFSYVILLFRVSLMLNTYILYILVCLLLKHAKYKFYFRTVGHQRWWNQYQTNLFSAIAKTYVDKKQLGSYHTQSVFCREVIYKSTCKIDWNLKMLCFTLKIQNSPKQFTILFLNWRFCSIFKTIQLVITDSIS